MNTRNLPVRPKARKHFRKSTLAMCMAALAAPAYAQNDAPAQAATLEEVVVYGIAQSLEDAQDIKRNASTVTDVITASDIGALPDKSIIEALQRVPGVAIQRFASSEDPDHFSVEGGGITVRGMNRIRAEFNGRDGFSAGADGGLNFSDIPPEMVGSVEVSKNQTADMVEGGIAGTINLITRKPFDSDDVILQGTVRGSYGDLIEEVTPSFSGVASNVWHTDAGKFGALLSLSASEFSSRGDGVGVFNFYPTAYEGDDAQRDYWAPSAGSVRQQDNNRDRLGFSAALQWANPSETVQATLEFIHSDSELSWSERFLEYGEQPFMDAAGSNIQLSEGYGDGVTFDCPTGSAPCQFTSGTILKSSQAADFNGVPYYLAGARSRYNQRVIDDVSFNLEYRPTDQLTITGDLQHTKATNEIDDITVHGKFYSDVYLDIRDDTPGFEMLDDNVANPASYFMRSAMDFKTDNEGDQSAFQLDGEYAFDTGWVTSVKAGIRVSNKTLDVQESSYNWGALGETWMGTPPLTYDQYADSGVVEQFTFENHLQSSALQGNDTFWFPSVELLSDSAAFYAAVQEPRVDGPTTSIRTPNGGVWVPLHERPTAMEGSSFRPSDLSRAEEDRQAVYVRVDFGDDNAALRYSGNIGLRYVNWQLSSTGANVFGHYDEVVSEEVGNYLNAWAWTEYANIPTENPELYAQNQALLAEVTQYIDQLEGEQYTIEGDEFSRVLPSFNLKLGVTDDLIVRFAASEAMYMPNLISVRNSRTVTPNLDVIRDPDTASITAVELLGYAANGAGNPYLQPELSTNLDLAVEWYFDDFGSLTSTLFHKKVKDYFRQSSTIESLTNSSGITNDATVTNTQNAGTATIKGYELAYQGSFNMIHEALSDFGVQASYTYIDGESTDSGNAQYGGDPASKYSRQYTFNKFDDLPLEGLSEENYNLVLFYDNGTFQSRFAYNWRSSYLLSSRDVIAFAPVFGDSTGQLDASFSWKFNDHFKIGLEANNLLDEVTRTSILNETSSPDAETQEGIMTPRSYFANDRRFSLFIQAAY